MFYDKFQALCKAKGVSVSRAATEIGLSNSTPTKWKKTRATPDSSTLSKVSAYFQVPISLLLSDSTDEKPNIGENKKALTPEGERKPDVEDIKIALFGGDGEVTDEMWEEALFAAEMIKARHNRKKAQHE